MSRCFNCDRRKILKIVFHTADHWYLVELICLPADPQWKEGSEREEVLWREEICVWRLDD